MADVLRRLALIVISLVLLPSSAAAHSNPVGTIPEHGATLETMPAEASLNFNEAPKTASAVLARPNSRNDKLATRIDGSTIRVRLPADCPRGTYTLSYRVVSADGHPVSGSVRFLVSKGAAPSTAEADHSPAATAPKETDETARGPLVKIVISLAALGMAAMVIVARSLHR